MTAAVSASYWEYLSATRRLQTLTPLIPGYMLHLTLRPYRKGLAAAPLPSAAARLRGRHAAASLDVWVDQLLSAYPKVAGYKVRRESGPLAIRYIRLMAALNREYEHRLATGQTLRLEQAIEAPLVADQIGEWEQFTAQYTQDPVVVKFMSGDDLVGDYNRYIAVTTQANFTTNLSLQIESIRLDSGGYLARLARLIDSFNERQSEPDVLEEFFLLGMAAKFADELADLATDRAEGRYNLLHALLYQHPKEHAGVMFRLERALPLPVSWWQECAPRSFGQFSRMFEGYYRRLRSPELQRICDATMLRALRGPKKHQSARVQQHVSEPPRDSWR
jgi:hypothetical protein